MRLVKDAKIAYINPPRTGTTQVHRWLKQATGCDVVIPSPLMSGHHTVYSPRYQDYYWFMSVRHPYTRCISIWRRLVEKSPKGRSPEWKKILRKYHSFSDLVLCDLPFVRHYWDAMTCSVFVGPVPVVHSVIQQETLLDDFNKLPFVNSRIKGAGRVNASKDKSAWHEHYTPAVLERIQHVFARDFEQYGYNRDFDAVVGGNYLA